MEITTCLTHLIEAAGKFNFKLKIGCPKIYAKSKSILKWAKKKTLNFL